MKKENKGQIKYSPHLWEITAVKDLFKITVFIVLVIIAWYLRSILLPVFLGLLLAYLFRPLIAFIQKHWRIHTTITTSFILILVIALVVAAGYFFIPVLIEQGQSLIKSLPDYLETLNTKYNLPIEGIPKAPGDLLRSLNLEKESLLPFLESVIGTSLTVFIWLIFIPFSFFVFSRRFDSLIQRVRSLIPDKNKEKVFFIIGRMDEAVGSFFRGRLIISLIIALLFSGGWLLVDVPYWFFLGTVTGLLSMVPYLSSLGWIAAILVKYLDMTTGSNASGFDLLAVIIWPTVVFQGVNILEEYVLTPWIQSKSTSLNPLTILVVVIIGGIIGGILGLLFAIPIAACIKIFIEEVLLPK
jgi:predicted PurR-regulated permease PerM